MDNNVNDNNVVSAVVTEPTAATASSVANVPTAATEVDTNAELLKLMKKQVKFQKISSFCMSGLLVVVLVAALLIVPKTVALLKDANTLVTKANESVTKIDQMSDSITTASEKLNTLVDENGESLTSAVQSLSDIDFEGLNKAIKDLQDAVGPMAAFFKKFN